MNDNSQDELANVTRALFYIVTAALALGLLVIMKLSCPI